MANYAINPTPELYLRSNRALRPARVIAALDLMKSLNGMLVALLVLVANIANASGFESCDLSGKIETMTVGTAPGSYKLNVRVLSAKEPLSQRGRTNTDRREYVGATMEVFLTFPSSKLTPEPGDVIDYYRGAVDVFDGKGSYAGKDVTFRLKSASKAPPPQKQ